MRGICANSPLSAAWPRLSSRRDIVLNVYINSHFLLTFDSAQVERGTPLYGLYRYVQPQRV